MKKFLLVLWALQFGAAGAVSAQNLDEVVYLKNGSIIRGVIIEQVPNESVKTQTRDGNIFVYQVGEIQKISKEQSEEPYRRASGPVVDPYRPSQGYDRSQYSADGLQGYFGSLNLGYEFGVDDGDSRVKFDVVNGYRIVPEFSIGVGFGMKYYTDADIVTIPVYAHLRSDFLRQSVTPFISLNAGYNISTDSFFKGGALVEPSIGVGIRTDQGSQFNISLGYSVNYFKVEFSDYYEEEIHSDAIMLHIGFTW